jgi:hypothetical protein
MRLRTTTFAQRWARAIIACSIVLTVAMSVGAVTASANYYGMDRLSDADRAQYSGWAYVSNPTAVPAWKWTSTGWQQASWAPGTSFRAYPWGSGWTWAYRNNAWFALYSRNGKVWQCDAPQRGVNDTWTVPGPRKVFHYNTESSQLKGVIGAGSTVRVLCADSFDDATEKAPIMAWGGPQYTTYMLVAARPAPACLWTRPACMLPEPAGGYPEQTVYLPRYGMCGDRNPSECLPADIEALNG